MYVCLCQNVTDGQIRNEVHRGAGSLQDLRDRLGVATCCGRCARCARGVLKETLREVHSTEALPVNLVAAGAT